MYLETRVAALRAQRFETIKRIASLAQEKKVDFALVAGDVFEDNAVSDETLRRTINAMATYTGPGYCCRVIMIPV